MFEVAQRTIRAQFEAAHHGLKIDSFERVASILSDVLRDAGMTSEDVQTVLTIVDSTRAEIVSE